MSAFLVTHRHVDVILTAALGVDHSPRWDGEPLDGFVTGPDGRDTFTADVAGLALLQENARAAGYRYNEPVEPVEYTFRRVPGPVDPFVAIKAAGCLEYQSCEHPGWETSEAKRFLRELTDSLVWSLPQVRAADGWSIPSDYRAAVPSRHVCHNLAAERGECIGGETCAHRLCVNVAHLALVPSGENSRQSPNTRQGANVRRTVCKRGHPLTEDNVYRQPGTNKRTCRECLRIKYRARRKSA